MPIFKIEKNSNYTVMSNYHLKDKKYKSLQKSKTLFYANKTKICYN